MKKEERTQITHTELREDITTDPKDIKCTYRSTVHNSLTTKLTEMDQFLEKHDLSKCLQDETGNLNRPTSIKETVSVINN